MMYIYDPRALTWNIYRHLKKFFQNAVGLKGLNKFKQGIYLVIPRFTDMLLM